MIGLLLTKVWCSRTAKKLRDNFVGNRQDLSDGFVWPSKGLSILNVAASCWRQDWWKVTGLLSHQTYDERLTGYLSIVLKICQFYICLMYLWVFWVYSMVLWMWQHDCFGRFFIWSKLAWILSWNIAIIWEWWSSLLEDFTKKKEEFETWYIC